MLTTIVVGVIALLLGACVAWVVSAGRVARAIAERDLARAEKQQSREDVKNLFVTEAQRAFKNVSETLVQMNKQQVNGSLQTNKAEFDGLLKPLREMVDNYRGELVKSEQARVESYGGLQEQIRALLIIQESAQREASRLANALQSPTVRGSWGEISLRRCVELAGMTEYCDYYSQETLEGEDGRRLRPDMLVRMPNNKIIAVDSKAPTNDYTSAAQTADEAQRALLLASHTRNLRRHVDALSRKEYQAALGESLDFTVMFLPGEQFLAAAEHDLVEYASLRRIYIATPTILIPLLRAVFAGWKAEKTEENAKKMHEAGVELFNRFVVVMDKVSSIGRALESTVSRYNETIRSIDARLWPKGEEMQRMAGSGKTLVAPDQLEAVPLQSSKLRLTMQGEGEADVVSIDRQ